VRGGGRLRLSLLRVEKEECLNASIIEGEFERRTKRRESVWRDEGLRRWEAGKRILCGEVISWLRVARPYWVKPRCEMFRVEHLHTTYLHTYIPTSIHTYLHPYIHTYIQTISDLDLRFKEKVLPADASMS
jgi:hypothetical protein